MKNKQINFKKERDFGDHFNATFNFITQEYKKLGMAILYFVVPPLLLSAISVTIYSLKAQELTQTLVKNTQPDPFAVFSVIGPLFGYILIAMIISLISSATLFSTVYGYIKLYISKGSDGFEITDVWEQVKKNFFRILPALVVVGIVVVVGLVLCIIPGIYLGVGLSIVFCIMIFEEKSFSVSFGRSLSLINKNFWPTLGSLFIVTIILYILMILVSLPSMLFGFKSILMNVKHGANAGMNLPVSYYIVNSLTQLVTQVLTVIPIVLTAFIYFDVVEKVEKPSLLEKIDQINENE
ncbi:MAG: hypothetical protein WC384_03070 [Prolixibacteraceae bacterium]|jgi:hypothetical protein